MDRLSNIIAFVTVAETGSFVQAAERLNIANSVVSKRIKDLEDYLGVRLLQRSTRSVRMTDAGYTYMDHARRLIDELAEVEENLRYQNENPVGDIRVSAPMSFANRYLGPATASFLDKYPDVSIRMKISDHHQEFADDSIDIAFFIGPPQQTGLIARKIAQSRRIIIASPAYLEKHGRPQSPADLTRHNCMSYVHVGDGRSWPLRLNGRDIQQPVSGKFTSDSGQLLCEAALNGCGITMLPTFIAGAHVMSGALEVLLEEYEQDPMDIQLVYQHRRHMSARVRKFIDHMTAYFSGFTS